MKHAVMASTLVGLAFSASAALTEVADGDSLDIGQNASGLNNAQGQQIHFLGAGTLHQVVQDASFDYIYLWPNFTLLGAGKTVTYNLTDYVATVSKYVIPRISCGLLSVEDAALKIKGRSEILVGTDSSGLMVNFPVFDVGDVSFVNTSDEPVTGTIKVNGEATIGKFPHKSVTSVKLDFAKPLPSTRFAFAGSNIVERLVTDDILDLASYGGRHVWLLGAEMPENATLRLKSGQHFQFRGASIDPAASSATVWTSVTGGWDRVAFPIEANGSLVEMYSKAPTCTFEGKVSGGGTLDMVGKYTRIFNDLEGNYLIQNTGSIPVQVRIKKYSEGSVLKWDSNRVQVTFDEGALTAGAIQVTRDGISYLYNFASGSVLPADMLPPRGRGVTEALTLGDGQRVEGAVAANATKIAAADGATVTVANVSPTTPVRLQPRNGTFVLEHGVVPDYWFDFSQSETMLPGISKESQTSFPDYIECVVDWRRPDVKSIALWNRRAYLENGQYEFVSSVYGRRVGGVGPNQIFTCLDFNGDSRRIFFSKDSGYNNYAAVPTAFATAVLVFNSVHGGGWGLVGTPSGAFARSGNTVNDGLTTNTAHRIWVDGESVVPTAAKLNGAWQIITIDLDNELVDGFGYGKYSGTGSTSCGGQRYGEILLFKNELSDAQRYSIERQLAAKWGVTYKGTVPASLAPAVVEGSSGTVSVPENSTAEFSGLYSGVIEAQGAVKIGGTLPPTADDVPSENRLDWYDAEDADTVCMTKQTAKDNGIAATNAVVGWLPRGQTPATMGAGTNYFYGVNDRKPYHLPHSNGLTPMRNWIDFNHPAGYTVGVVASDGNVLRCRAWTGSAGSPSSSDIQRNLRQAFMALDSSNSGGAVLGSAVGGASAPFYRRAATASTLTAEMPIWSSSCATQVKNSATRLNGTAVVGTSTGFTGEAEVLSFTTTADASFAFIDAYVNTEHSGATELRNGAIVGEAIFYTAPISDEDAAKVEAYLLGKWTGSLPDGYADFRNATVTGAGSLEVVDLATMPKIGANFTGSLKAASGTAWSQTVTIDPTTDEMTGALACAGKTFDLPAAATCTLTVDFTVRPATKTCRYTIVDCAANVNNTAFNVVLGANAPKFASIVTTGNKVEVVLEPRGMLMIIK